MVEARKHKIGPDAAWDLLKDAAAITGAKGKKIVTLDPKTNSRDDILAIVMGPGGTLKAPALRVEDRFMAGFNPDMYDAWLGGETP